MSTCLAVLGSPELWFLGLLLLGLLGSAFYSGIETGLYTVNRLRLDLRRRDPADRRARTLHRLLSHPDYLLCVFLIGNNLANALAASVGEAWMSDYLSGGKAALLTTLILTPLLFLRSEALPKHLFHLQTEAWTYRLAPSLKWSCWILSPLALVVLPLARVSMRWATGRQAQDMTGLRRRNQALARLMSASDATVSSSLRQTALEVGERQARPLREIMVPWDEVVCLPAEGTRKDLRDILATRPFLRYPLRDREGDPEGYVYYLDPFLDGDDPAEGDSAVDREAMLLSSHMRPLVTLEPTLPWALALARLEGSQSRLGLVRDGDDQILGIVTVRDLAEALLSLDSRL